MGQSVLQGAVGPLQYARRPPGKPVGGEIRLNCIQAALNRNWEIKGGGGYIAKHLVGPRNQSKLSCLSKLGMGNLLAKHPRG